MAMEKVTVVYIDVDRGTSHLEYDGDISELFADIGTAGGWFVAHDRVPGPNGGYLHSPVIINGAIVASVHGGWN